MLFSCDIFIEKNLFKIKKERKKIVINKKIDAILGNINFNIPKFLIHFFSIFFIFFMKPLVFYTEFFIVIVIIYIVFNC